METIYLDHASTTPLHPVAAEAMRPLWFELFGNPASAHHVGRKARQAIERARETVASCVGAEPDEVIFTSGATEANNLAVFGLAGDEPASVLSSPIEHPSVAEPLDVLVKRGFKLQRLTVNGEGVVRLDALSDLIDSNTRLAAVMLANNETGAIQPVRELAEVLATATQAFFHCDAVQAVGKIPVSFRDLGVTSLSLSGHKFQGPRGVGALVVKRGAPVRPLFWGGHQQRGVRPGTEPVVLAVGLAAALEQACREIADRQTAGARLRQIFLAELERAAAPIVLNGPERGGLPHVVNVSFPGCRADALLIKLDLAGVACATGSACSSGSLLPSPVLTAMGLPADVLGSAMRFSFGPETTEAELVEAAARISRCVRRLRETGNDE